MPRRAAPNPRINAPRRVKNNTRLEAAALRWVGKCLGENRHERQVRVYAQRLFDLTHQSLRLGSLDLHWLRLAALLHDIGRCVSDKRHPQEGARMILNAPLPLSAADRRAV
ncbi:MAG TPA: HD domain-containing protein, partial [Tepidisphaeraceae bacterium]